MPLPVLSKAVSLSDLGDAPLAASCDTCDDGALDFEVRGFSSPDMGSIEMVSLGPVTVTLSKDLKMFLKTESEMGSTFVRANCVHFHKDGMTFVTGVLKQSATAATQIKGTLEDLSVDVRVAVDDEPKMVRIQGAKTKTGRVISVHAEANSAETYCMVDCKGHPEVVALTQVVAELKELEMRRRDAQLLLYQKQLTSMMLDRQRRRRLGLQ